MEFDIRFATDEDIPSVIDMMAEFADFELLSDQLLIDEQRLFDACLGEEAIAKLLVVTYKNENCGYSIIHPRFSSFRGERSIYIEDVYIRPDYRDNGLGEMMMTHIAKYAHDLGYERMDWQTLRWNINAIRFYERLGAEVNDENVDIRIRGTAFDELAR